MLCCLSQPSRAFTERVPRGICQLWEPRPPAVAARWSCLSTRERSALQSRACSNCCHLLRTACCRHCVLVWIWFSCQVKLFVNQSGAPSCSCCIIHTSMICATRCAKPWARVKLKSCWKTRSCRHGAAKQDFSTSRRFYELSHSIKTSLDSLSPIQEARDLL